MFRDDVYVLHSELTFNKIMTSTGEKWIPKSMLLRARSSHAPVKVLEETTLVQVNFEPMKPISSRLCSKIQLAKSKHLF